MNEGRLLLINQQSSRVRKLTQISNMTAKRELSNAKRELENSELMTNRKLQRRSLPMKRSLLYLWGYRQCLKKTAHDAPPSEKHLYGQYIGHGQSQLKTEIERTLAHNEPCERRKRAMCRELQVGKRDGRLIDTANISQRFGDILSKPGFCFGIHDEYPDTSKKIDANSRKVKLPPTRSSKTIVLPMIKSSKRKGTHTKTQFKNVVTLH